MADPPVAVKPPLEDPQSTTTLLRGRSTGAGTWTAISCFQRKIVDQHIARFAEPDRVCVKLRCGAKQRLF
jgi:hypothetical protein